LSGALAPWPALLFVGGSGRAMPTDDGEFAVRTPFIAGNWKMNADTASAAALAGGVRDGAGSRTDVDLVICPPFPYLGGVRAALQGSRVQLGAQNCYCEARGAFTGEISPLMLKDVGCAWVILGHSERRQILGETDELIQRKVGLALASGLRVILCVGETLARRQKQQTEIIVRDQLAGALAGLRGEHWPNVVIAYEPVWAIGTGVNATPDQAQTVHAFIRSWVGSQAGAAAGAAVRILYGGSVNPDNAASLLAMPDVDGFLVGGASLKVADFCAIINNGVRAATQPAR
jgi:triosephosphate isomerase